MLDEGQVVDVGTEAELTERCPLFRALLAGPGDAIEELAGRSRSPGPSTTTASRRRCGRSRSATNCPRGSATAELAGGVGDHGAGAFGALPPTPELLAAVEALPPATDVPRLPGVDLTAPDPRFRLAALLRPVRWALLVALVLVGGDALASDGAAGAGPRAASTTACHAARPGRGVAGVDRARRWVWWSSDWFDAGGCRR